MCLTETRTGWSCKENEMLSIFCKRLELAFRANETDSATARIIHFQNWLSTNGTQQSFVPFYRHWTCQLRIRENQVLGIANLCAIVHDFWHVDVNTNIGIYDCWLRKTKVYWIHIEVEVQDEAMPIEFQDCSILKPDSRTSIYARQFNGVRSPLPN